MRRVNPNRVALALALAAAASAPALAQTPVAAAAKPAVEQEAIAALTRMGAYLRSLKSFQLQAVTTSEDVLDDGQKVQYEGQIDLLASMPDKFRLHVTNDRIQRLYLYDGKSLTLSAERVRSEEHTSELQSLRHLVC